MNQFEYKTTARRQYAPPPQPQAQQSGDSWAGYPPPWFFLFLMVLGSIVMANNLFAIPISAPCNRSRAAQETPRYSDIPQYQQAGTPAAPAAESLPQYYYPPGTY